MTMTAMTATTHSRATRAIERRIARSFGAAQLCTEPYRYWLLHDVLPAETALDVTRLPFAVPEIDDTRGRRETHNSSRVFFSPEQRAAHPVMEQVAAVFQGEETVKALERLCGIALAGTNLRIEYCQDTVGFWLEPHTDIQVKKLTMLIYLSSHPDADDWGTDVFNGRLERVARASGSFNRGLIFVPATDTWHGFERRTIAGVRRSLIINYVGPEWRAVGELAYPDQPIGAHP